MKENTAIMTRVWKQLVVSAVLASIALVGSGCASARVSVTEKHKQNIVEPDFVIVHEFEYAPKNVKLDRGILTKAANKASRRSQEQQEFEIGKSAAQAMADGIVANLRKAGIQAYKAGAGHKPTGKTLVISGKFIRIDQGNRTTRVVIGFGFGSGDIKALVECTQGGRNIAKAIVTTSGSLKPGMAVPVAGLAGGANAVSVTATAVSGAATGGSELLLTTVQADAQRAAKEIAIRITQGYINHNWVGSDAIRKINAMF